jgi:hypothetical protein
VRMLSRAPRDDMKHAMLALMAAAHAAFSRAHPLNTPTDRQSHKTEPAFILNQPVTSLAHTQRGNGLNIGELKDLKTRRKLILVLRIQTQPQAGYTAAARDIER